MKNTQLAPIKRELKLALEKPSFQEMLELLNANGVEPKKVIQQAFFAIRKNNKLLQCDHDSILTSIGASAIVGLDCTGTLGQAYLVPFGKECVLIVGYQGLIELARRSGHINRIEARPVYENDTFEVIFGGDQVIKHAPTLTGKRGELVCAYAIADIKNAGQQIEIMRADEINLIRDRSPGKGVGPWKTDYSEMCRKTVVRRLIKYIPKSPELVKAVEYDDGQYDFESPGTKIVESEEVVPVADRIKNQLGAKEEKPVATPPKKAKGKPKKDGTAKAGSDAVDPAPPEDPAPEPPEGEEPADAFHCNNCGRDFPATREGKCPECISNKVVEL